MTSLAGRSGTRFRWTPAWLPLAILCCAGPASAGVHERSGFTLELGVGPAAFQVLQSGEGTRNLFCPAVTIGIGGFFSESMALMLHLQVAPKTSGFEVEALALNQLKFQVWFDDHVFLGAAAGLAIYSRADAFDEAFFGDEGVEKSGFGLSLRSGYSFANWEDHSLRITLEVVWAAFAGLHVLAETLALEWQFF